MMISSFENSSSAARHYRQVGEGKTVQRSNLASPGTPVLALVHLEDWARFGGRDFPEAAQIATKERTRLSFRSDLGVDKGEIVPFCRADADHEAFLSSEEA
jgi:hypothetical protein